MAVAELLLALTWLRLLGGCALLVVAGFVADYARLPRFPEDMPAVGYGRGLWGHVRSNMAYFARQRAWLREGHVKYGRGHLPFLVPAGLSRPPDVVLPRSMLPWLLEQPESAVDAHAAHNDAIYGDYNFLAPAVVRDSFGSRAVAKWLTRSLPGLLPAIDAEVRHAVGRAVGHVGAEWTRVRLWDVWLAVVPPVTNRVLAGTAVCRQQRYLDAVVDFTHAVLRNCVVLRMCPAVLHPVVGRLLALANRRHWRRAHALLRPVIQARVDDMTAAARGERRRRPPEDLITWLVRQALAEGRPDELDPDVISMRLLPLEVASIDTTVLTGLLWMLDLLSSSPASVAALVDELRAHEPPEGAPWSTTALLSLVRVDSSIRESQRLSNFHATLIDRVVLPPAGLRLDVPGRDWILPRGAHLTVNLDGLHHDDDFYDDAGTYDALRFSRLRERRGQRSGGPAGAAPLGMVSMNDHHFSFGHGRFTCPGRFFVAHELRLIAAQLLLNYEFKMLDEPPRRRWIGSGMMPPFGARVEMRRKRPADG